MANLTRNYYTPDEAEFVRLYFNKLTTKQIAKKLKKSYESVRQFKYRNDYISPQMAIKSRVTTKRRMAAKKFMSDNASDKSQRELLGIPSIESEESILLEMQALINLCELTNCKGIREKAKVKLAQLSEIPINNQHGLAYLERAIS